ncbi:MAG: CHRD domain-containing protein [Ferruginibacter sp.]
MTKNYKRAWLSSFLFFFLIAFTNNVKAGIYPFSLTYSGANENPPNSSTATGTVIGTYDDLTNKIFYTVSFTGLTTAATGAHFHAPATTTANGPVIVPFTNFPAATSGTYSGSATISDLQETQLFAGLWYANIHSSTYPGGELRVQVILGAASNSIYTFSQTYSGLSEVPPNASTATGTVSGTFNSSTNRVIYTVNYSGLSANATGAHFHAPALPTANAPVIVSFSNFPATTAGTYSGTAIVSDLNKTHFLSNLWYANIHTATFPGGEIRAQIIPLLPASITCPANITVSNDAGLCFASVNFSAVAAGIPTPTVAYSIGATAITSPHVFPVGTTMVTATATNSAGTATCSFTVTVNDTEGPAINNLAANPSSLWPPNHKMKDVEVNYTSTDNCPGAVNCIVTVSSNEPVNGLGDGDMAPDWLITDNHHIKLRAERSGNGTGRIYTITTTCTDLVGNSSSSSTTVTVPLNASNAPIHISLEEDVAESLSLKVLNNPGRSYFTLMIQTNKPDRINVRLMNSYGRIVESKNNVTGNQQLNVGSTLQPGVYWVEVQQGNQRTKMQLVKLK